MFCPSFTGSMSVVLNKSLKKMKFAMKETADMVERRYYRIYIFFSLYFGPKEVDHTRQI